jgi:hypothetical protein
MAQKVIAMPFSALPTDEVATALRTDRRHGQGDDGHWKPPQRIVAISWYWFKPVTY